MSRTWMVWTARILSLLWGCWWVFFETAEAIGSGHFGQAILFAVVMLGPAALAWKWERVGGWALVLVALAAVATFAAMWLRRFSAGQVLILFLLMVAPPLVSGILFLVARRRRLGTPQP